MSFDTFNLLTTIKKENNDVSKPESNPYKVMIVLSVDEDKDLRLDLLPNILKAIQIDISNQAFVIEVSSLNIDILKKLSDLNVSKVISFGLSPKKIALNLNPQLYRINNINGFEFLFSDNLSTISSNQERKKALWAQLQLLFPK